MFAADQFNCGVQKTAGVKISQKAGNFFIYLYLPVLGTEPDFYVF